MLETLSVFQQRTSYVWDSLPASGSFVTNPGLTDKVGPDGKLLPFFGDTVIFPLASDECAWLREVQQSLYTICGSLLAQTLPAGSFHITLHDLNSAPCLEDVAAAMALSRDASLPLIAALDDFAVEVRPTAVFSMVNTSVVLGFEPISEADCTALMNLYERFQQVVPLSYPLTPHVTLAYYRPGDHGEDGLRMLRNAVAAANHSLTPRIVRLSNPQYCRFADMSRYIATR